MAAHKLEVGQRVTLHSKRHGVWAGPFEVVRLLPHENGNFQYRIKSIRDGHERVVFESELAREMSMEASYRIVSQADGTFAVARTEFGKEPVVSGHLKTEAEARAHIADLEKMAPQDKD